jgi:hypothetical protein
MGQDQERARAQRFAAGVRRRKAKEAASLEKAADRLVEGARQGSLPDEVASLSAFSDDELNERVRGNREVQAAYVTDERRRQWREQPVPDSIRKVADTGIEREKAAKLRRQYVAGVPDLTAQQRTVLMLKGQEISEELLADLRGFPEILAACGLESWDEFEARIRGTTGRGGRITEKRIGALLGVSQPAVAHLYKRGFGRVLAFARRRDLAALEAEAQEEWDTRGRAAWEAFRDEEGLGDDADPEDWGFGPGAILENLLEMQREEEEFDSRGESAAEMGMDLHGLLEDLGHQSGNTDASLD